MQYAINEQGKRVIAYSGGRGVCPVCFSPVLAKVGIINVRHWAHISCDECDNWSEPETLWHRQWKDCVPETWREVVTEKNGKRRRADIMRPDGIAVELQHSSISVEEIVEREAFYGNMTWIFDARAAIGRLSFRPKGGYHTFRWKQARKTIAYAAQQTFLDIGHNRLFEVKKAHDGPPFAGWGYMHSKASIVARINL